MAKQFIRTSDPQTAIKLEKEGFQLVFCSAGIYTFANDPNKNIEINFANDLTKFTYTNKLEF